jgi:hypothetical protein
MQGAVNFFLIKEWFAKKLNGHHFFENVLLRGQITLKKIAVLWKM